MESKIDYSINWIKITDQMPESGVVCIFHGKSKKDGRNTMGRGTINSDGIAEGYDQWGHEFSVTVDEWAPNKKFTE